MVSLQHSHALKIPIIQDRTRIPSLITGMELSTTIVIIPPTNRKLTNATTTNQVILIPRPLIDQAFEYIATIGRTMLLKITEMSKPYYRDVPFQQSTQ